MVASVHRNEEYVMRTLLSLPALELASNLPYFVKEGLHYMFVQERIRYMELYGYEGEIWKLQRED